MRRILFGSEGRLRNAWWMLLFALLFLASRALYRPLAEVLKSVEVGEVGLAWIQVLLVLAVTGVCLRLRREGWREVGLRIDRRWGSELGTGTLLGVACVGLAVGTMALAGGVTLSLDERWTWSVLARGIALFLAIATLEELLFRGFLFQRLIDGIGAGPAMGLISAAFACAHWGNPGLQGDARILASVEIGLGALLLGLAWLRTQRLALPIGLHLGWNFAVGPIFGFDVSGFAHAGAWQPQLNGPDWLTGGAFGLEASVCAIAVDLVAIALLWRWKGNARSPKRSSSATAAAPRVAAGAAAAS